MILTIEELRQFVETDETDTVLMAWLEALEETIKGHTHNTFHKYKNAEGVIEWPADIRMGVVNLLKWELGSREKIGIASETISRHSVTYADRSAANMIDGYPAELMGFLRRYKCARFGQGLSV